MLKKVFRRIPAETIATVPAGSGPAARAVMPTTPSGAEDRLKVLFLCIGNSCRSPMAEGLARKYGSDVMLAESAGLSPFTRIDPFGIQVMKERNIDISDAFPKGPDEVNAPSFDLIVNMSGQSLKGIRVPVEDWNVPDPFTQDETAFQKTADQLEQLVMRLILQIRLKQHPALSRTR